MHKITAVFTRQKPMIKFSNSSGLKENNAVKIVAA